MDVIRYQVLIGARFAIQFVGICSSLVLARTLKAEGIGSIGYAIAFVGMFQTFSELGFGTAHIKRISEGRDLGKCVGTYLVVKAALSIVMVAAIAVALVISNNGRVSTMQQWCIGIIGFASILENLARVPLITFSAMKESAKQASGEIAYSVVLALARLLFALAGVSLLWQAWSHVLAALSMLLFLGWMARRSLPIRRPDREDYVSYAAFALPFMLVGLLSKLVENIDIVMIGWFCGPTEVGHYAVALSVARNLLVFAATASTLLFPTMSRALATGAINDVRLMTLDAERLLSLFLLPIAVFVCLDRVPLARLLWGKDFMIVTPTVLAIMIWFSYLSSVTQPYVQLVPASGRSKMACLLGGGFLGLNLLLNVLFIPDRIGGVAMLGLGARGAAVACVTSMAIASILYRLPCRRKMGILMNRHLMWHALAGVAAAAFTTVAGRLLPTTGLLELVRDGLFVTVTYIGGLIMLGEVSIVDYNRMAVWLNPVGLLRYCHNEIRK